MKKTVRTLSVLLLMLGTMLLIPSLVEAKAKVSIKFLGKTKNDYGCECAFMLKNNTGKDIDINSLTILGKSSKGKPLEVQETFLSCIGKGQSYVIVMYFEDKNVKKFEYDIEWAKSEYKLYKNVSVKASKSGKKLIVTIKNKKNKKISGIRVSALFYKKGKLVEMDNGSHDTLKGKGKTFIQLTSDVKYDKYKLYYRVYR